MLRAKLLIGMPGVLFLLVTAGNTQIAAAQSTLASVSPRNISAESATATTTPTVTTSNLETEQLRNQIEDLQERLDKLEAKQRAGEALNAKSASSVPLVASRNTTAQDNSAKPAPTQAGDKDTDKGFLNFLRDVEVSGFIDGYYGHNFNRPFNRRNQLRNFDFKNNEFALNLAELVIEKKAAESSRFGFRMDLDFGAATDWVHSVEPGGADTYKHIQQVYGSFLAPVGKGLQIDVGKFVTQHGAEVIESKDNWNYTRSFLFAWAIPYYHAGVRASYTLNNKVSVMADVVNGWNNVEDNNGGKTVGFQLLLKPTSKLSILQNYMVGPEESDAIPVPASLANKHFVRQLYDSTLSYTITTKVAAMVNYDYGTEHQRAAGNTVHWQGVAAYLRYTPTRKWAFAPRFEWYDDHDGFTTCSEDPLSRCSQRIRFKEITLTGEYKFAQNVIGRLEFRNDWADIPFFRQRTALPLIDPVSVLSKNQTTITGGIVFTFSTHDQ